MTLEEWLRETRRVTQSERRGHAGAALRRLGKLRRALEKRATASVDTPWNRALVRSLEAGVYSRAGHATNARRAYLQAATVAHGEAWANLDLLTNSLWAAAREARLPEKRVARLYDRGARLLKSTGDMLNEHLIAMGMPPVVFGGKYPAVVVMPHLHRIQARARRRRAQGDRRRR